MNIGKKIRLRRIINPNSKRTFMLAMDHGFSYGQLPGLENVATRLRDIKVGEDTPNAVIVHQGIVPDIAPLLAESRELGLVVHLSGSTSLSSDSNDKRLVCSVEQAARLGADAVSVHVNLGARTESQMVTDLGMVSQACQQSGMPLLAMMYPRGENIKDPYQPDYIGHAIRVAVEMGVDIVKTNYTGEVESFSRILEHIDTPVVIAGGPKADSEYQMFQMLHDALQAGAAGVSFGRNIFQSNRANRIAKAAGSLIHQNASVQGAMEILENS